MGSHDNTDSSSRGGRPDPSGDERTRSKPRRNGPTESPRLWTKAGQPARGDRDARSRDSERDPRARDDDRDPFGVRAVRQPHVDPELPDDVVAKQLDRVARNELKTLSAENAEAVARHLVMAGRLIDTDPEIAYAHAMSAARRAGRIGVARETLAIAAYALGDYALALRELRTYRRITGNEDQLPMMVDCERGLGRAERALELGRSVPPSSLTKAVRVELAIAMSGARLDVGQVDAALGELEIPELDPSTAFSYSPDLFYAYSSVLEELGRASDARIWSERADRARDALDAHEPEDDVVEIVEEAFSQSAPTRTASSPLPEADDRGDARPAPGPDVDHG